MRHLLKFSMPLAAALFCAAAAQGEVFELANGGRIEGELLNRDESPRESYQVKTPSGGVVTLSADQVARVVSKTPMELRYEAILPKMPATADGNWKMAEWCREAELPEKRELHLRQAIALDPNHVDARHALGYSRVRGEWVNPDERNAEQGYVRHRGAWITQQELELLEAKEQREQAEVEWRIKVRRWRGWIAKGRDNAAEGLQNLQAIADPYAAAALIDLLNEKNEPSQFKLLYIDILGRLRSDAALSTFIELALNDADGNVRDRALDQLIENGGAQAAVVFSQKLEDKDNAMVNRAAAALARLGDPSTTLPLINALVTEHKYQVGPAGGAGSLSPTFGSGPGGSGAGGLNVGGRPKIVKIDKQNQNVLAALTAIHRGPNFGYNEDAWLQWYIQENTPESFNLRRVE